ncbi:uncharacterized protein N7503_005535 [Penicillium pulvis]|uniref:uncharacterized protein n=1 Tax=Penicillium pulvis TaxID=1562058 RepID=UPI0025492FF6|nr:uncharacterized protein N7503_005535 [Penicillium pulvis]KAJ5803085.1 hypothetical protein N7503_005535 [Penicillium pulvis]
MALSIQVLTPLQTSAVSPESNISSEYKSVKQQVVWRHKPLVNNNGHAVKKHRPKEKKEMEKGKWQNKTDSSVDIAFVVYVT